MKVRDLFLFLFGHRASIERIASSRWAWLIGLLLVATAGIARNYDHLYLIKQREWFVGPLAMSLISTVFIFITLGIGLGLGRGNHSVPLSPQFRTFLTLFWLTAPCAWLYAIPVENYTDLLTSTKWNLAFLAIVSVWRVFIISRAVTILTGAPALRVVVLVLWPATFEMILGSAGKRVSLIQIMGGVRLPPHNIWLREATEFTLVVSIALFVILSFMLVATREGEEPDYSSRLLAKPTQPMSPWLWPVAFALLGLWAAVAMKSQPIVARNYELAQRIKAEDWKGAIAYASQFNEADFSHIHYLPPGPYPKLGYHVMPPSASLLINMNGTEPAWLRRVWLEQTHLQFNANLSAVHSAPDVFVQLLENIPDLRTTIDQQARELHVQKAKHNLTREDREWLLHYEYLMQQIQSPPSDSPTK